MFLCSPNDQPKTQRTSDQPAEGSPLCYLQHSGGPDATKFEPVVQITLDVVLASSAAVFTLRHRDTWDEPGCLNENYLTPLTTVLD